MGVTGLWKLIEPSGKPVPLETLENKILAIDISIWLHQVVKGFQDSKGATLPNAHLLGLFHRLCKLLYYKIKPVFIFDGGVPDLKRETMKKRNENKNKYHSEADRLHQLLLSSLVQEKVVQQALGPSASTLLTSPLKVKSKTSHERDKEDIFKLPPIKDHKTGVIIEEPKSDISDSDSSLDEKNIRHYNVNLQSIDVTSSKFQSLPADIRHDILTDIKETRKQSSWGRLHELPAQSDDFSTFQMKRLLKRRQVQVSLENAEKEMGGKNLSVAELESLLTEEGIVNVCNKNAKRIDSDENTYNFYIHDLKNAMKEAETNPTPPKVTKVEIVDSNSDELDEDLQRAIQLSLEECCDSMEQENNDNDGEIKLRTEQKKALSNAAKTLARAYMIEYGGLNSNDVNNLVAFNVDEHSQTFKYNDPYVLGSEITELKDKDNSETTKVEINNEANDSDDVSSGIDSDFVDVPELDSDIDIPAHPIMPIRMNLSPPVDTSKDFRHCDLKIKPILEVVIKADENVQADDLFDDIFVKTEKQSNDKESIACIGDLSKFENKFIDLGKKNQITSIPSTSKDSINDIMNDLNVKLHEIKQITLDNLVYKPIETSSIKPNMKNEHNETVIHKAAKVDKSKLTDILNSLNAEINEVKIRGVKSIVIDDKKILRSNNENIIEILDDNGKLIKSPFKATTTTGENIPFHTNNKSEIVNISNSSEAKSIVVDDVKSVLLDNKIPKSTTDIVETLDNNEVSTISPLKRTANILYKKSTNITNNNCDIIAIADGDDIPMQLSKEKSEITNNIDEIIEILDDDVKKTKQSDISSYLNVTPIKTKKPIEVSEPTTPKVTSPFFRKKTPSSKTKTSRESEATEKKVSKSLFKDDLPSKSVDSIAESAKILRDNVSTDDLLDMAAQLGENKTDIEYERNKQDRLGVSITNRMQYDCQELLKLFGIPYIVAPMEAEAQCAFLENINLTNGTITDDSDIWLFGGKTVYKNFFNQQKNVMEFREDSIQKLFNVDRHKMIQLSVLVGSDYTAGITGIGAVTALEILATFKSTPVTTGETTETMSLLSGLRKFREWWESSRNIGPTKTLRNKLKNIIFTDDFPSLRIIEAYLYPEIDTNRGKFSWGDLDAESIREYTKTKFGWTFSKTNDILLPVLKKLEEKKSQSSIRNYFQCQKILVNTDVQVSKRVRKAIDKMSDAYVPSAEEKPDKNSKVRKKRSKKIPDNQINDLTEDDPKPKIVRRTRKTKQNQQLEEPIPSTSNDNINNKNHSPDELNKIPNIPQRDLPIPQREKDIQKLADNKLKAIELMKQSRKTKKSK